MEDTFAHLYAAEVGGGRVERDKEDGVLAKFEVFPDSDGRAPPGTPRQIRKTLL